MRQKFANVLLQFFIKSGAACYQTESDVLVVKRISKIEIDDASFHSITPLHIATEADNEALLRDLLKWCGFREGSKCNIDALRHKVSPKAMLTERVSAHGCTA